MEKQVMEFASGNEMAVMAIRQIGYDLMGYYPITPSTQIAENLDRLRAQGDTDLIMIAAEGEHSACGDLLWSQCRRGQSDKRHKRKRPYVCSGTVPGSVRNQVSHGDERGLQDHFRPLSIKGDHSDIMFSSECGMADPLCPFRAGGL